MKGQHSNHIRVVLRRATQCSYAVLWSAATQSCYAELRCAPQSYAEQPRAALSYDVLRYAMQCYAVPRSATLSYAVLLMRNYVQAHRPTLCFAVPC